MLFVLVLAFELSFVMGLKDLIKEINASRVRKRKGLPRPID
ncbi:MAG: hypothetical protein ACTH8J_12450 [Specibacter sp.]